MKKGFALILALLLALTPTLPAFAVTDKEIASLRGTKLYVYNWGEYISDGEDGSMDVNAEFEKKYGIKVIYTTYDNNETMYAKIKSGGIAIDLCIPSDYMVERMIDEDMVQPIDFGNIPNYKYIAEEYKNLPYDPDNRYSVPYNVGKVGIIYNTTMVKGTPTSWSVLWDEQYKGQILQFGNPRDAFAGAQSLLGLNYNSEDAEEWRAAAELLKEQKAVLQSYVNDEVFNKMESGEAALAPYYAGDYLSMADVNPDLAFFYPEEGVNTFVDAMCILKNAQNKTAAELYINFMLDADVALANAEYICYASPNTQVINNPDYTYYQNEILYPKNPPKEQIYTNLSDYSLSLMNTLWDDVKNYQPGTDASGKKIAASRYTLYLGIFALLCLAAIIYKAILKKYRENY